MASPNLPEFDGTTRRIILAAGITQVNVESDLYSQWKEWFKIGDNAKFPPAFRTVGGDPLTPGINAGAYFFIQNQYGWRIRPPEEDTTIFIEGNLAPEDSTLGIVVPTIGTFRVLIVGLQPITQNVSDILSQVQDAAYEGVVAIDPVNGVAGTSFPTGTRSQPSNNLADAITIASSLGINSYELRGSITLTQDFENSAFIGVSSSLNDVVNVNGFSVDGTQFTGIQLTGTMTGVIEATECQLNLVLGLNGVFRRCGLEGSMTLAAASNTIFDTCHSHVAGLSAPVLTCGSGTSEVNIRNYSGGIELRSMEAGTTVSVDLDPGKLTMHSSNVGGVAKIRGVGEFDDSQLGSPRPMCDTKGLLNPVDIKLIKAITAGDAEVSLDDLTVTVYDPDIITSPRTVLATYSISADGRVRTKV